ncbi:MAG: hypothetical protein KGI04_03745 [Candidatus Micrarchaeota archaeon]|nr:hypothetical protein [Candidatus Micrarchaeota archaeon]
MGGIQGLRFRKDAKKAAANALSKELKALGYSDVYLIDSPEHGFLHAEIPLNIDLSGGGDKASSYVDGHDQKYAKIKEAFGRCGLKMSSTSDDKFEVMAFCMIVNGVQGGGLVGMIHDTDVTGKQPGDPEEMSARVGAFFTLHNKLELFVLQEKIPEAMPALSRAAREACAIAAVDRSATGRNAALRAGRRTG